MSLLAEAIASSGGGKSLSFKEAEIGDFYEGTVLGTDIRQARDYTTGESATWPDGSPKEQVIITLETDERDDELEDDDGTRSLYIKKWGNQWQRLKQAVREAGDDDIQIGGHFKVTFVGVKKSNNKKFNDEKLYEYKYTKPTGKVGKAVAEEASDDDEVDIEDQIRTFIGMGWSDSKIRKALPDAKPKLIASIRDEEE